MRSTHKTQDTSTTRAKEANALELLKADHEKVSEMFTEYEQAHAEGKKSKLVAEICTALTIHAQVEEEIFYPAAKAALNDKELVPEASVEHAIVKELIAQIESDPEGGEMYEARVRVLIEAVKHHIKEEQGELFRKLRHSSLDLAELGVQMAERFDALRAEKQGARH